MCLACLCIVILIRRLALGMSAAANEIPFLKDTFEDLLLSTHYLFEKSHARKSRLLDICECVIFFVELDCVFMHVCSS
jgi:hypothetical protein